LTLRLHWDNSHCAWQAFLDEIPSATFFHTPMWADTFAISGRGRYEILRIDWPDGRQAIVPIGIKRIWRRLIDAATVGIDGGYGGVLATGPVHPDEWDWLLRRLVRRYGDLTVTTNPFAAPWEGSPAETWQPVEPALAVPLAPLDQLRRAYSQDRRRVARRFRESGIRTTVHLRPSLAEWQVFCRLYQLSVGRWLKADRPVTWIRSNQWLEALWQVARERLILVIGHLGDRPVGAEVMACQGGIATELFAVWDPDMAGHHIGTGLTEVCLEIAFAKGCRLLDAMPSGELAGVARYKASFGAVPYPIRMTHHPHWLSRVLTHGQSVWAKGAAARLWRIPVWVTGMGLALESAW
jgi:hypothetical protein